MILFVQIRDAGCEQVVVPSGMRSAVVKGKISFLPANSSGEKSDWVGCIDERAMNELRKKSSDRVVLTRCLNTEKLHRFFDARQHMRGGAPAIRDESNGNKRISPSARQGVRGARVSQAGLAIEML
jgi:hypothetical protein